MSKRIMLLLTVVLVMAVMIVASAAPAFARGPCGPNAFHPGGAPAEPDFSEPGPGADGVELTCTSFPFF